MVRRGTRLSVASVLVLLSATADARIPGSHVPHAGVSRIQTRMGAEACAESPPAGVAKACSAATVLQHNWFDAANGVWANTAFWGSANGLSAVAALAATEGSGALLPAMRAVHSRHPGVVVLAEAGGSWDDAYWWVLAFLDAHAVLRDAQLVLDGEWLTGSRSVAHTVAYASAQPRSWRRLCGGTVGTSLCVVAGCGGAVRSPTRTPSPTSWPSTCARGYTRRRAMRRGLTGQIGPLSGSSHLR